MKTTIYSADDLRTIVNHLGFEQLMDETISTLESTFRDYSADKYSIPPRDGFEYKKPDTGLIEWMPTMANSEQVVLKLVGYHPSNPVKRSLPSVLSTALLMDTQTGHANSIIDCTFLTALRTGAASAIASKILASANAKVLGLIGCGAQAVTQLQALSRVFEIKQVFIYDTNLKISQSFKQRIAQIGLGHIRVTICSLNELTQSAEIICTTTSVDVAAGPVFVDENLHSAVHVNAVGADFPGKTEVPLSLLKRSIVTPDFREQARIEGECQVLTENQIGPDFLDIVKSPEQYLAAKSVPTVFDSTGWALEDFVMVNMFVRYGQQLGLGEQMQLASTATDPNDPYSFIHDAADSSLYPRSVG